MFKNRKTVWQYFILDESSLYVVLVTKYLHITQMQITETI